MKYSVELSKEDLEEFLGADLCDGHFPIHISEMKIENGILKIDFTARA